MPSSAILSTPCCDDEMKQKLSLLTGEVKSAAKQVRARLRAMDDRVDTAEEEGEDKKATPAVLRIQRTQQAALFSRFAQAMAAYGESQVDYRARCKARIERHLQCLGKEDLGEDELEEMLEQGTLAAVTSALLGPGEGK